MNLRLIIILLVANCLISSSVLAIPYSFFREKMMVGPADDEYERYKREGDELVKKGEYEKALKKFQACLVVPNFSNDTYAKGKIEQCKNAVQLRKEAETALSKNDGPVAVERLKQILVSNPDDPITRKMLADYWEKEGNLKYNANAFEDAKTRYAEALKYTDKKEAIRLLIQKCTDKLAIKKQPTEPARSDSIVPKAEPAKPVIGLQSQPVVTPPANLPLNTPRKSGSGLKILTGTVGVGAGLYAMILNGQWKAKLNALNDAAQTADPNNDGIVDTQTAYNQWQTASAEAKAAQSKHGLFVACVGLATGAALLETYLLLHKPKPVKGLSIQPASQSVGIALRFDF